MEQETMKAVRQAELSAEQIEKDAAAERECLLSQTKADADKTVAHAVSDAKSRAALVVSQARKQGESLQTQARADAEREIAALRIAAASGRDLAKKLILSELT